MMNTSFISGVIYKIFPEEKRGDFRKRVFWIQQLNVKYPEMWQLEMHHDNTLILDRFKEGFIVECDVTVRGKLWQKQNGEDCVIMTLRCDTIRSI